VQTKEMKDWEYAIYKKFGIRRNQFTSTEQFDVIADPSIEE
jgi:hypothetical protein